MKLLLEENINRLWASLLVHELYANEVYYFVVCPGMRNAPLIAAVENLVQNDQKVQLIMAMDERAAAYRALGYTKAQGFKAALLCTSGTAVANFLPAVIEAFKSQAPLIVVSADRPKDVNYSDDNQTIHQENIFKDYIRGSLILDCPTTDVLPQSLKSSVSNIIKKGQFPESGPVHINIPFREPLENDLMPVSDYYLKNCQQLVINNLPATRYLDIDTRLNESEVLKLAQLLNQKENGLIIIGSLSAFEDLNALRIFLEKVKWNKYIDISSSLKYEFNLSMNSIPTFDHPEIMDHLNCHIPEIIFHIGGRLTSKHYYTYLKGHPEIELYTLNKCSDKEDPSHHTKVRINADIGPTLRALTQLLEVKPFHNSSLNFSNFCQKKIEIIDNSPLCFPKITKRIIELIPDFSTIYIGNSTAVRSFDSYFSFGNKKHLKIATNRGVSGIEGFVASAIGLSDGLDQTVYLVLGDVSLFHDLNSIHYIKSAKNPVKIILINNFGGGIFDLLPISKEENVLKHILTPHKIQFEKICQAFDLEYQSINKEEELNRKLNHFFHTNNSILLEIFVNLNDNKEVYQKIKTIRL